MERDVEKLILTDRATRDVLEADTCREEVVDGVILMVERLQRKNNHQWMIKFVRKEEGDYFLIFINFIK